MKPADDQLSYAVIGEAMAVHRELGPGLREELYHQRLAARLREAGVEHFCKPRRELVHRGMVADVFEPDLVVPAGLVPELKHLTGAFEPEHVLQLKCYLKFWRIRVGLLFDFGKEKLLFQRYILDAPAVALPEAGELLANLSSTANCRIIAEAVTQCVLLVTAAHGFGYRDTTYAGLLRADFAAEGIRSESDPVATVTVGTSPLGESQFGGFIVERTLLLKALSQRDAIRPADRAIMQTWLRLLNLPVGVIVHFGKTNLELQWVNPHSPHRSA